MISFTPRYDANSTQEIYHFPQGRTEVEIIWTEGVGQVFLQVQDVMLPPVPLGDVQDGVPSTLAIS